MNFHRDTQRRATGHGRAHAPNREAVLHEFLGQNREEILATAEQTRLKTAPNRARTERYGHLAEFFDDLYRALRRERGLADQSPLPISSPPAVRYGDQQYHEGLGIDELVRDIGSISSSVGAVGRRRHVSFSAADYEVFNLCIDTGIAQAIERYWQASGADVRDNANQRLGLLVHELRNALNAATCAIGVLEKGQLGIQSKVGQTIVRAHDQMRKLLDHAMIHVRVEKGMEPAHQTIRLCDFLRDLVPTSDKARAALEVRCEVDESLEIVSEEFLLTSALSNLVQNAVNYSPDGAHIVLRAYQDGECIVVSVRDQCGGLSDDEAKTVLEPFVRGESSTGMGLGLAVAREAADALGGTLTFQNLPGEGCIFSVELPTRTALPLSS